MNKANVSLRFQSLLYIIMTIISCAFFSCTGDVVHTKLKDSVIVNYETNVHLEGAGRLTHVSCIDYPCVDSLKDTDKDMYIYTFYDSIGSYQVIKISYGITQYKGYMKGHSRKELMTTTSMLDSSEIKIYEIFPLKDSLWEFYDNKGNIVKQEKYVNGKLIAK